MEAPNLPHASVVRETAGDLEQLKAQFLASLNHEIRTPLSGLLGMTELLLETRLDDEQQEYASAARLCAENLLEVLNATLEFSSLASGNVVFDESEFYLAEMIEAAVLQQRPKAEAKGITLTSDIAPDLPELALGDPFRLRQMLAPIIDNAIKFTPSGSVEVKASSRPLEPGIVTLEVTVRDSGIGISPEKLSVIFESFRQLESGLSRSYPGLGLGLAISRKLAHWMAGDISVESEVGVGTTFQLSLPVRVQDHTEVPPVEITNQPLKRPQSGRYSILVVDDNEVAQQVVRHVLRRGPYDVVIAGSGRQAIEAVQRTHVDLILMDLQMPEMNGLETAAEIRKLNGYVNVPVLALTANFSDEYRILCHQQGLQAFISKPVQSDELLAAIERHLK